MRKLQTILLMALIAVYSVGCLEKTEISAPEVTVSGPEDDFTFFSEITPAIFKVNVVSAEELSRFRAWIYPFNAALTDSIKSYDRYVHTDNLEFRYQMKRNALKDLPPDSTFTVTFQADTRDTSISVKRKIRYRLIYPELDSFDVTLGSSPTALCLLDVTNKTAYPVTDYASRNFDLVYVNELRPKYWEYGTCLASPDAPCLKDYFENYKLKDNGFVWEETDAHKFRYTECGYVNKKYNWSQFNAAMLGRDDEWVYPTYINQAEDYNLGVGFNNLQKTDLLKFRLYNGKYVMIKVLNRENSSYPVSTVDLRVYLQKEGSMAY